MSKDNAGKDLMDFFATSDDILRLSLLTLVLRAAPQTAGAPTTFSPSCTEAARASLHRHQDCMAIIEKSSGDFLPTYVHWYVTLARLIHVPRNDADGIGPSSSPRSSPSSWSSAR